jgi:hypothetical protein
MTLIARLRILLNNVDPQPMRQIEVPLKIRLDRLQKVIRAGMDCWTDTRHRRDREQKPDHEHAAGKPLN